MLSAIWPGDSQLSLGCRELGTGPQILPVKQPPSSPPPARASCCSLKPRRSTAAPPVGLLNSALLTSGPEDSLLGWGEEDRPVPGQMFSSVTGFCSPAASENPSSKVVMVKNVPRQCRTSPAGQESPWLRTTALEGGPDRKEVGQKRE